MTLDEIIISNFVLFEENNKLKEGGKKFLEHISKYSKKVILLGFKPIYAEQLIKYISQHLKNTNLKLERQTLTDYIGNIDNFNNTNSLYIATNVDELNEGLEWQLKVITFNQSSLNPTIKNFKQLKDITGYISDLKEKS